VDPVVAAAAVVVEAHTVLAVMNLIY